MYTIQVIGAVDSQVEIPGLNCLERAYKYFSSAVKAVEAEINEKYSDTEWYKDFKYKMPTIDSLFNPYYKVEIPVQACTKSITRE